MGRPGPPGRPFFVFLPASLLGPLLIPAGRVDLKHSAAAAQLHDKGSQMVSKLDALKGDAFARAYVTEMINGHKEALQMLDDAIKSAQRDEVRQHLTAVRQTVAMHLRTAEGLQSPAGTNQKGNEPDAGPDERAQFVTAR
jgi:TolA-binding protein